MEPCAGFAERSIRRASEKHKGWDSLEVDEGFATVARAKSPPDSILDRKVHKNDRSRPTGNVHSDCRNFFGKRVFGYIYNTIAKRNLMQ